MADYDYTVRRIVEHRWSLPTPANGTAVYKMILAATRAWAEQNNFRLADVPDDAIIINTTEDGKLVVSYITEESK